MSSLASARIPRDVLVPVLIEHMCREYNVTEEEIFDHGRHNGHDDVQPLGVISRLAFHAVVARENLTRLFNGTYDDLRFDIADKLFVALHATPMVWHEPPLDVFYWSGLVPPDLSRPVKCENPECPDWFEVPEPKNEFDSQWKRQRFCDHYCSVRAGQFRRGERVLGVKRWRNQHAAGIVTPA